MDTVIEKHGRKILIEGIRIVKVEAINCFPIREKLDDVFSGAFPLEETQEASKRILFDHLRTCKECCRSFDVRVRYSSSGRDRIF